MCYSDENIYKNCRNGAGCGEMTYGVGYYCICMPGYTGYDCDTKI